MTLNRLCFSGVAVASMSFATMLVFTPVSNAATVGFNDAFDESNFSLNNTNADGSIDTGVDGTDGTIVLTGGDNGSFTGGTTDWTITMPQTGTVSFTWSFAGENVQFSNNPPITFGDRAGYLIDGSLNVLANVDGESSASPVELDLNAGQTFGFRVETANNIGGAGELTVNNFEFAEPVPFGVETNTGLVVLMAGMGSIAWRRHRRRSQLHNQQ